MERMKSQKNINVRKVFENSEHVLNHNLMILLLCSREEQPVPKINGFKDEKIGRPVTILARFNWPCSYLLASNLQHPSQNSVAHSKRGLIYVHVQEHLHQI